MAGFDNETLYADNYDFRGVQPVIPQVTAVGQLPIGTGGSPAIKVGTITSSTLTVGYSNPNITLEVPGGAAITSVLTANATPQFSLVGSTSTVDFDLTNLVLGSSLPALTTGTQNVGMGQDVFPDVTSGDSNVAIGWATGNALTEGIRNTFVGTSSGNNITTGDENTLLGSSTGSSITTGNSNVGIGHDALETLLGGIQNIHIKNGVTANFTGSVSSSIIIGGGASPLGSNTIRIGQNGSGAGQQNRCFIAGIAGITVSASEPVAIDTNGQLSGLGLGSAAQVLTSNGAGSSPTWQAPGGLAYTDQASSVSVTSDSGSFSTAAITLTLPASPAQGDVCEFVASTSDQLVIQAAGTQVIHIGNTASSATGTATSSAIGDSLSLVYQSSTDDWWALNSVGNWTLA